MPQDTLTLSLRLHDPAEKKDAKKSTSWAVIEVPRADLAMPPEEFAAKHLIEAVRSLEHFQPKP